MSIVTDDQRSHEPNSARPVGVAEGDDAGSDWSEAALSVFQPRRQVQRAAQQFQPALHGITARQIGMGLAQP